MTRWMGRTAAIAIALALPWMQEGMAAEAPAPDAKQPASEAPKSAEKNETPVLPPEQRTEATVKLNGRTLSYAAYAGAISLKDSKGQRKGDIAYVAYTLQARPGVALPVQKRPITFVFNGGPGSASAWMHIGLLGPKRLAFGNEGDAPSKAPVLVDNNETWLDFTDLVFLDPVGTGWSRPAQEGEDARKNFWGVNQDIESLSRFIAMYLAKTGRLQSPKYLVGESYGGFRAPLIAHHLLKNEGVGVAGMVMLSPVIDFAVWQSQRNGPLDWVARLPSMAAAALEKQGQEATPAKLAEVERYAAGEYLVDLLKGRGDAQAIDRMVPQVSRFVGLSPEVVKRLGARIDTTSFIRELRRDQGQISSRYDASVTAYDPYPEAAEPNWDDPILEGAIAPVTSAIVDYVGNTLNWKVEAPYQLLNREIGGKWEWSKTGFGGGNPADASEDLRKSIALDKTLRVLVAHGTADLVTPYFASRIVLDQIPTMGDPDRVRLRTYPGGHMFYTRDASRAALRNDAKSLYPEPAS